MYKEFKEFAIRGNVVDMAVGIIIGGAFGTIANTLVNNVLMPPIGLLVGGVDFSNLFLVIKPGTPPGPYPSLEVAQEAGAVTIDYGIFMNSVISFLIVAFAVFILVRTIHRLRHEEKAPAPAPTTKDCPHCATAIPLAAKRCPHCTSQLAT
jgi:large conductance mechanosensitive channel